MTVTGETTATSAARQFARVKYVEPDVSADPWKCDFYALPPPKSIVHAEVTLHDLRPEIFTESSPYKLETHGFTAVKHQSALLAPPYTVESRKDARLFESIYLPEVNDIVKAATGARKVFALNAAVRYGPAISNPIQKDSNGCGYGIKLDLHEMGFDEPPNPRWDLQVGPARDMHIDFSPDGARQVIRYYRNEIIEEAQDIIATEDAAAASNEEPQARRYAMYSVWRPLNTVTRDPIAVLHPASYDADQELVEYFNKQPGPKGPFIGGVHMLKGDKADSHRWYWISGQENDEVLLIQFFDSHARKEGRPVGAPHGSPELLGVEHQEWRQSIEVRVVAFW
ncbi:hypothetical protein VTN77DRAFT_1612 [Rasamsonia byssochlamydoides]|uniref:uncharacterized protein n=1 Tax=Rasamsonia byssochlamydoides TaxID=89139 RepID=UPI0037436CD1